MKNRMAAFALLAIFSSPLVADVTLEVSEDLSHDLDGYSITYAYELTRAFQVRFEDGQIAYRYEMPDGEFSDFRSPIPYFVRTISDGIYYVGWHEEDVSNYVTLLIDVGRMEINSSALLGDYDVIHFQNAAISQIARN